MIEQVLIITVDWGMRAIFSVERESKSTGLCTSAFFLFRSKSVPNHNPLSIFFLSIAKYNNLELFLSRLDNI